MKLLLALVAVFFCRTTACRAYSLLLASARSSSWSRRDCHPSFASKSIESYRFITASSLASSSSSSSAEANAKITNSPTSTKQPTIGSIVTIECDMRPQDGWIPDILMDGITLHDHDTLRHRLTFCLGDDLHGFYPLPGLHQLVQSMQVGESTEASIDAGWGARNPDMILTLRKEDLQGRLDTSQLKEGDQLLFENGRRTCVVTQVTDDTITIDANPPLAGSSYLATVTLIQVEDPPSQLEYIKNCVSDSNESPSASSSNSRYHVATFALGCFWGGELAFVRQLGVVGTKVGYTQGAVENPTYEQVCSGTTGHTEASQVIYDPTIVSYHTLVQLVMDRLGESKYQLNQVGNDRGSQYRHGIYYHNDEQKKVAEEIIQCYGEACVTECVPATKFWDAEAYHQQYLYKGGQSAKKGEGTVIRCYG